MTCSNESAKLAAKESGLRKEIWAVDSVLQKVTPPGLIRASFVSKKTGISAGKAVTVLDLLVEAGVLSEHQMLICPNEACSTLNKTSDDPSEQDECTACDGPMSQAKVEKAYRLLMKLTVPVGSVNAVKDGNSDSMNSPLERKQAGIEPWSSLAVADFLVSCVDLGALEFDRIHDLLVRRGICLVRMSGAAPTMEKLAALSNFLGVTMQEQNDYAGEVKTIEPKDGIPGNTGDSKERLGAHVDGTQSEVVPAMLMFQYRELGNMGAESTFWDAADYFAALDVAQRKADLIALSRKTAAKFAKKGMSYEGPLVDVIGNTVVGMRARFDEVATVHPDAQAAYDRLAAYMSKRAVLFQPQKGDVVIFDNRRVLHGREKVYGDKQRLHDRVWLDAPFEDLQAKLRLGVRPVNAEIIAAMNKPDAYAGSSP